MEEATTLITESQGLDVMEAQERVQYDIQISTAKKFPRTLKKVQQTCIDIVCMDDTGEVAASCSYALPRAGKTISGPSVHLARIIAQQFGNIRVDAKIKQILYKEMQIVSEAVCFDLETNYACKVEVRKSIRDKQGHIYNNDMIAVTGNAANSIAFRNAVFNVVPRSITDSVVRAAKDKITADIKNEAELTKIRKKIIDSFKATYNVPEDKLLKAIGLTESKQITKDRIPDLRAMFQSLKDGDMTVEEMFNPSKKGPGPTQAEKVAKTFGKKDGEDYGSQPGTVNDDTKSQRNDPETGDPKPDDKDAEKPTQNPKQQGNNTGGKLF
jgi:hypothetical protein